MAQAISPIVSLATSMHAQPGVYAVLLGSGVSTGAGILTGWGVVRELVSRLAAAAAPDDPAAAKKAWDDPDAWWNERGDGNLGYAELLDALAATPAARQGLLADFFEPDDAQRDEGIRQPSKAHQAIADLVKRGYVRVIVTTNFDRLMEQSLEAIGISPQVISRPEAVNGMAPLAHAPATIIKLHGDYKDLGTRNTPEELSSYPDEWKRLLAQIFDEYGLVISGWSADWDEALVAALEEAPNRRYPLYWDARSSKGGNAHRLLNARAGLTLPAASADELFTSLASSIDALERLASPPLSTAMAVARLKRYLPDPVRRLDLHDLVMNAVDEVVEHIAARPLVAEKGVTFADLQELYENYFRVMEQPVRLLATGVWHDQDGAHTQLWIDALQCLVDAGVRTTTSTNDALAKARLIPALIAWSSMSLVATRRSHESLLIRLSTDVEAPMIHYGQEKTAPAAQLLHYRNIWSPDWINGLPRWDLNGRTWLYPASHLMVTDLRALLIDEFPTNDAFVVAYHGFEYRAGLIQTRTEGFRPIDGEYVGEGSWEWEGDVPKQETIFRRYLERTLSDPWLKFYGGEEELETALVAQREVLKTYRRW